MSMTRRLMLGYSAASLALLAGCAARVTQTLPAEEGTAAPAGSSMQALMDRLAREYRVRCTAFRRLACHSS